MHSVSWKVDSGNNFAANHNVYLKNGNSVIDQGVSRDSNPTILEYTFNPDSPSYLNAVTFSDVDSTSGMVHFLKLPENNLTFEYATAPAEQQAIFFSEAFLREMTCDGIGSITNDVWNTFNSRISTMSAEALTVLKTAVANEASDSVIEQAMARYDLIASKYEKANFLNRETAHSANRLGSIINDQNNTLLIIMLFSACVLVVCFIKIRHKASV